MHTFSFQDMLILIGALSGIIAGLGGALLLGSKIFKLLPSKGSSPLVFGVEKTLSIVLEQNEYLHRRICEADEEIKSLRQSLLRLNNTMHTSFERKHEG